MRKQSGVAIVIVLLVVALVSIIATNLNDTLLRSVRRTSAMLDNSQAMQYTLGAEKLALALFKQDEKKYDDLTEEWAQPYLYPIEEGGETITLSGQMHDLNNCFNLNLLVCEHQDQGNSALLNYQDSNNPACKNNWNKQPNTQQQTGSSAPESNNPGTPSAESQSVKSWGGEHGIRNPAEMLQELLSRLELEDPERIVQSIADWIDTDDIATGSGSEDLFYGDKTPGYRSGQTLLMDKSELRLIGDIKREEFAKLESYICVLPTTDFTQSKINVNTLLPEHALLLTAIIKGLTEEDAESILSEYQSMPIREIKKFWEDLEARDANLLLGPEQSQPDGSVKREDLKPYYANFFDVKSTFFELTTEAVVGDGRARMVTNMKREGDKISVQRRRLGGLSE